MLQALKLESASTPVTAPAGDKGGADPANGLFAAAMATAQAPSAEAPPPSPAVGAPPASAKAAASQDVPSPALANPTSPAGAPADAQGNPPAAPGAVAADASGNPQAVPAEAVPAGPDPAGTTPRKTQEEAAETSAAALAGSACVVFPVQTAAAAPCASGIPAGVDASAATPAGTAPAQTVISWQECLAIGMTTAGTMPSMDAAPAEPAFTVPASPQDAEKPQPSTTGPQSASIPPAPPAEIASVPPNPGPSLAGSPQDTPAPTASTTPVEGTRQFVAVRTVTETVSTPASTETWSILQAYAASTTPPATNASPTEAPEQASPEAQSTAGAMTAVQVRTIAFATAVEQPRGDAMDLPLEAPQANASAPQADQPGAEGTLSWASLPVSGGDSASWALPTSGQADGTTSTASFLVLESALRMVRTSDQAQGTPAVKQGGETPPSPDGTPVPAAASGASPGQSQPVQGTDLTGGVPALTQTPAGQPASRVDEAWHMIPLPGSPDAQQEVATTSKAQAQEPGRTSPARADDTTAGAGASGSSAGAVPAAPQAPGPGSPEAQGSPKLPPVAPKGETAAATRTPDSASTPQDPVAAQSSAAASPSADQSAKAGATHLRADMVSGKTATVPGADDAKTATALVGTQQQASSTGSEAQPFTKEDFAQGGPSRPDGLGSSKQTAPTAPADAFGLALSQSLKAAAGQPRAESAAPSPASVFGQVDGSVRWILQKKGSSAELQLHPDSLGRVTIQLKVEGQEVHAKLWASEASTLPVLQEHKAFLEASLKEQGLNLGSFSLQTGTQQHQAQTAFQERAAGSASGRAVPSTVKQEIPSQTVQASGPDLLDPHQIEVYA